jgi:uncharacterized lipoprotein YmbA
MLVLSLTGCASDPTPTEQLRLTEQALAQAKAVGADEQVAELAMAEAKLLQAQSAMQRDAFKEARVLAEQAELDARLAEARVLTQKSQDQLNELNNRINRLRKQVGER